MASDTGGKINALPGVVQVHCGEEGAGRLDLLKSGQMKPWMHLRGYDSFSLALWWSAAFKADTFSQQKSTQLIPNTEGPNEALSSWYGCDWRFKKFGLIYLYSDFSV